MEEFNGFWRIVFHFEHALGIPMMCAYSVILNGRISGVGAGGPTFRGSLRMDDGGSLVVTTEWDAAGADPGIFLPTSATEGTAGTNVVKATLKTTRGGDTLFADGVTKIGDMVVQIVAERLRGLDE